jgi:hypothetical protein
MPLMLSCGRTDEARVVSSSTVVQREHTCLTPFDTALGGSKQGAAFARMGGERPEAYLAATQAMNSARLQGSGASFNAVASFAEAAATTGATTPSAMQSSIGSCW